MYTILIRDDKLGRGFPCGYMFTNDHSVGPIVQWLLFLKKVNAVVDPLQFTIDCSDTETEAINTVFPRCQIQYCLFHVSQAWNRKLGPKVNSKGQPCGNRIGRSAVNTHLKMILYEEDKKTFHRRIADFVSKYESIHPDFINYLRTNWFNEAMYNVWSVAYHPLELSHMVTNNYIESWHNQLKSVYLRRSRNKRLDRLVFILTEEVEFFYAEEFDRIEVGHGPMTAMEKERRKIEIAAENIPEHRRTEMIRSPKRTNSKKDKEESGTIALETGNWIVDSFIDENSSYNVFVNESNGIVSCTCFYHCRHQRICQHMQLLRLHVPEFSLVSPRISKKFRSTFVSNTADKDENITVDNTSVSAILKRAVQTEKILHHNNEELLEMKYISKAEANTILKQYELAYTELQKLKDKYSTHFRKLKKQQQYIIKHQNL